VTLIRAPRPRRAGSFPPAPGRNRGFPALAILVAAAAASFSGCGLDGSLPQNPTLITALPVATRVALPGGGTEERRRLVDGAATDPEWNQVPYNYIAMGPEYGNQGGSFVASVKVAHDSTRLYLLVQWPDQEPNRLGPRLVWDPYRRLSPTGCDSLIVGCVWRLNPEDEDRLAIMWDMGNARDASGTFKDNGCQVACHGNMHPLSGAVDIWQWRAARTNPIQFPLTPTHRVGFADDGYADSGGRVDDPGLGFFRSNIEMIDCEGGGQAPRPLRVPDALDSDGRPTIRDNDFMRPCEYIFEPGSLGLNFCSRRNPCRQFEQEDDLDWLEEDELSATLLNRPDNEGARRSRHDVEARAQWVGIFGGQLRKGVWTLEMSRRLTTGNAEDIDFDVNRVEPYSMAIAIMDNDGRTHSGSPVIQIHFQP
jgi:hypothetical protein